MEGRFWDCTDQYSERTQRFFEVVFVAFGTHRMDLGFGSTEAIATTYAKWAAEQRMYLKARRSPTPLYPDMVVGSYGHFCALHFQSLKTALYQKVMSDGLVDGAYEDDLNDIAADLRTHQLIPPSHMPEA